MKHRFLEAEDAACSNHGKFSLLGYDPEDFAHPSPITGGPLLTTIPCAPRFHGPITPTSVWLLDLQTQEGMLFDVTASERALRRRFLVHPLHVCILYWPLMRYLAREDVRASIWTMPPRVTFPQGEVFEQPGVLVDATGVPVRGRWEWSARKPLTARLRNREVAEGGDPELGQDVVTFTEQLEKPGGKPRW